MSKITNLVLAAKKLTVKKLYNAAVVGISYMTAVITSQPVRWGMPLSLSVEPTNYCNLHCPQCPTGLGRLTRPKGYMDPVTFRRIIDQTAPYLLNLFFYFQGEPFLNQHLPEFIRYASDKNIYTALSTNANVWTENFLRQVIHAGLDKIIIPLDGSDQQSYEKYRRGGQFSRVVQMIDFIAREKLRTGQRQPVIEVQVLMLKHTENQQKIIKKLALDHGADTVKFKTIQICDFSTASEFLPLTEKFSRYNKAGNQWQIKRKLRNRCWRLWNSVVFTWDGTAVPCCYDKDARYALGNIHQQDIKEIITGEKFQTFARQVLTNQQQIDICRNCWG